MGNPHPLFVHSLLVVFLSFCINKNLGDSITPLNDRSPLPQNIATRLRFDPFSLTKAGTDYGKIVQENPAAVLHPSSIHDIITLIKFSNNCSTPFGVATRGRGHSVRGQATARGGVVIDMSSLRNVKSDNGMGVRVSWDPLSGYYADVGGEQLWADVLRATLEHGLAPASWTDYLYLTVGGTLSNGGISGQSFLHGPQISNVLELDVITGKGDFFTCSHHMNSELFFAVLGGLGQFGIITRARITLQKAPTRAKWVRLMYTDFSQFTSDQEHLMSKTPDYLEGSLITHHSPPNNWRSNSFYSPSHYPKITSLLESNNGILFSIEVVKYYDHHTAAETIDNEMDYLLRDLKFVPGFIFKKDVTLTDFLGRVEIREDEEASADAHPWLNIFVPKSRILDFNAGVFLDIIGRQDQAISGPILFYPFIRKKWDERMSAVIPDEDIFYTLGLLHTSGSHDWEYFDKLNNAIVGFCEKGGIKIKQYLPHYKSEQDWMKHFGPKWKTFVERKNKFDPRRILSPGQRIFVTYDHEIITNYSDV